MSCTSEKVLRVITSYSSNVYQCVSLHHANLALNNNDSIPHVLY